MRWRTLLVLLSLTLQPLAQAQKTREPVPHNQDQPPNPARSPQEAAKAMTVPPGFTVEVVASEPDLVNPVAMTFDERGRIWVTESFEYPRSEAGPGRDRIKILEDTNGDGTMDKSTIFAEGLNIPSGIAVGGGGVWVANAPDLLFLQDTNGDDKADKTEVVLTGFGRDDTHELPNSLTWGPDGWLYGLNGVFNRSVVKYRGRTFDFTCALFRIHPKTREFELFAEGTSNPWGVAWNADGEAFLSACVIDHLWHLTETGYYHRQGGPYPPHTWKIESIVNYKHQKAAYCGIQYFDSDAYPPEYRDRLYMGNIHGGCINVDGLVRNGSTYKGAKHPDFLTANDAWFMPVSQKVGPDGSLYILDWYDRYHCYQDARRDPDGIDRLKGRLYRVRYKDTPRVTGFDLTKESDDQLIDRLHSPNLYFREIAQRLLAERDRLETRKKLEALALRESAPRKTRLHALWSLVGTGRLDPTFHLAILAQTDPTFRAWGVRAARNMHDVDKPIRERIMKLVNDPAPEVRVQVAIAPSRMANLPPVPMLLDTLSVSGDDPLIPRIVWQNLHPLLAPNRRHDSTSELVTRFLARPADTELPLTRLMPRVVDRLLDAEHPRVRDVGQIVTHLGKSADKSPQVADAARASLRQIATGIEEDSIKADDFAHLTPFLGTVLEGPKNGPLHRDAVLVMGAMRSPEALRMLRGLVTSKDLSAANRLQAFNVLIGVGDPSSIALARESLRDPAASTEFRGQILASLGRLDDPKVAGLVLDDFASMSPDLQPRALELLTQRPAWSKSLVKAIESKAINKDVLNVNQIRRLLASKDADLVRSVRSIWGTIREGRNPQREQTIGQMRRFLGETQGDPSKGAVVFKNLCGQCHKIYGEGQEVGPEITSNGRGSYDQLLSNVFDPSLVIGEAFQATSVATTDGRVLTGLAVENSPQRIILKIQGGKVETIPRDKVDDVKVSALSLMPEDLEKQLKPQEIADLFSFLILDKPPTDPASRPIPGAPMSLLGDRKR